MKNQEDDRRTRKKQLQQQFLQKSTGDSRNLGDRNRQSNRQDKINKEKRSEGENNIKDKKENERRDGRKNKMQKNRK